MGRLDNAMRRAAAAAEATGQNGSDDPSVDTTVLADEALPDDPAIAMRSTPFLAPDPPPPDAALSQPINGHAVSPKAATRLGSTVADRIPSESVEKLVVCEAMPSGSREQYRRLAAVLHASQEATGLKVVMVASAVPAEGKTLTASNLALTLSESYQRRTLLIDADLRRPSLEALFGLARGAGLSECLKAPADTPLAVQHVSDKLSVLPAGRPDADPLAGLTSDRMNRLLTEARGVFDWIIIDTPPVMLLPDAHVLASMVDGALLVIRADATPYDLVRRAVETIERNRILGVVLNSVSPDHQPGYGSYQGYYQYYQSKGALRR